jgi:uncharacterized phage protein gp47/JayE
MATIPQPRSFANISGSMLDTLLAELGIPSVRVGSAVLSIIEAAAQSDLRSSQDILNLLNSVSLDRATGQALDRLGLGEDAPRLGQSPASGKVTISDSSFSKIATRLFQGKPAPIVGSSVLYVSDASSFPSTGAVYVGRGTSNYEGPLTYSSKINNVNYWTLNLDVGSHTTKYHNLGEGVVLAQGGDRAIPAGTVVQTATANASSAVDFSTQFAATIPDGEVSISGVLVVAKTPGVIGNVIDGSIREFASTPFTGATVTNPTPFSNGLSTEDDATYRERIRAIRQSRSRATPLAIKTGLTGIVALDENKRAISCSVVRRQDYPTTVYLDDGTGYEESSIGIPLENLVDRATGGEQYFQLVHGRPVSKAQVATENQSPYVLSAGSKLAVKVGGVLSEHSFNASDFRSIENASAYEVVSAINSNSTLPWMARTTDSGTRVSLLAKKDTEESIEVVVPGSGTDANEALSFGTGINETLKLYLNDILLSKDGSEAVVVGNPQASWATTSSGATLLVRVDGIDLELVGGNNTYIFNDIDFVNAGTPYRFVSATNSLESWAAVLNYKIPGVTATVAGGSLTLTSNRGRESSASIEILGGTLVSSGLFSIASSFGKNSDYTLDRNLGQIRLEDSLVLKEGDRLSAGSYATRAFLESEAISTLTIGGSNNTTVSGESGAELWFAVDGSTEIVKTRIGTSTQIIYYDVGAFILGSPAPRRIRISHWSGSSTTAGSSTLFENALPGDWIVAFDTSLPIANRGAWRIVAVNSGGVSVDVELPASPSPSLVGVTLAGGGISVVRTPVDLQRVYLPAASNYTSSSLVTALNAQLRGATAAIYRTRQFRIRTNTASGDIALVAANDEGVKVTLPISTATSQTSHLASVLAGNSEAGTPEFEIAALTTITDTDTFDVASLGSVNPGHILVGLKALTDTTGPRYSNRGHITPIEHLNSNQVNTRRPAVENWLSGDRIYAANPFALTPDDEMTVVVDGDVSSKRFALPLYRKVSPTSTSFTITNEFKDADNSGLSLAKAFGLTMDWRDFAVFMPARTKSHSSPDTNKTLLWRYKRLGLEGNRARVQYIYPTSTNQPILATWSLLNSQYTEIKIRLASAASARTGATYSNSTKIGLSAQSAGSGLYNYQHVLNLPIASGVREVRLNYTGHDGTFAIGQTVTGATASGTISFVSSAGPTGYLILTSVTGTYVDGENLSVTTTRAQASGSQYGYVTLTLTNPSGITDHGFQVNDQLHIEYNGTGSGAGFLSGNRSVTERTSTTIRFVEGVSTITSTSSIGTVSFDSSVAKLTGSTVVVGDIQTLGAEASVPSEWKQSLKLTVVADGHVVGQSPVVPTGAELGTTLIWHSIVATANLFWFPLGTNTISAIASAINAQTEAPVSVFVAGDGLGDTSGSVAYASYEANPNGLGNTTVDSPWYYLTDGLNWVRSQVNPANDTLDFQMTFKSAIGAVNLATNSDWANESVYLVPITAENVAEFLSTSGPGGLYAAAEVVAADKAAKPQITSITAGSGSSVQVQGGTANGVTATVKGQATQVATSYSVVTVAASDTKGLSAGHWVMAQNSVAMPKNRIDSNTNLDSIGAGGSVVFDATGTKAWSWAGSTSSTLSGNTWQIEKQGRFVAFQWVSGSSPNLTGVQEGDWVIVGTPGTLSQLNAGTFRIVRISNTTKTFWIENSLAVEETATASTSFLSYDSIMPGDKLLINTSLWGVDNLGTWTVASIDLTNQWKFTLDVTTRTPVVVASPGPGALSTSSSLVQVVEGAPSRLFKKIHAIAAISSDLSQIKFDSWFGSEKISESAGTVLSSLDKLAFSTNLMAGIDGYRHSIGLLEEANKVGYGVESDPSTYPGLIAAGTSVNIEGPMIRRLQLALSLRIRSGVSARDIRSAVRSAVASAVNSAAVGRAISLSEIVATAQSINGVVSVVILSPSYGASSDLISVQPFEKPMILDLDNDIQISLVGE